MPLFPRPQYRHARRGRRAAGRTVAAVSAAAVLALTAPSAALADQTISTAGPLTSVRITPDLNCAVDYAGDTHGSFFDGTACGTFVAFGEGAERVLAGPSVIPAGGDVAAQTIPVVPVEQTMTGSGSRRDPFAVTTVADARSSAGPAVLRITQVDSYVTGDNYYATTTTISSLDGGAHDAVLFHGADCYLGDNDQGYGDHSAATGAVTCTSSLGDAARIEQFIPQTPGSSYFYGHYRQVWSRIAAKQSLPDLLASPSLAQDNGMALSWNLSVPAGGSASASMLTNFSPMNIRALPTTITPDATSVRAGSTVTVAVDVSNADNAIDVMTQSLEVLLPRGAVYVEGSVVGASGPAIQSDRTLAIPIVGVVVGGGSTSVTFQVVLTEEGAAAFDLTGSALLAPVLPSTASVAVSPAPAKPTASDDTASTSYATAVTIPVLDNDTGEDIAVTAVDQSEHGVVTLNDDGTITFVPVTGFAGTATFEYTIADAVGQRASATVIVEVRPMVGLDPEQPEGPELPATPERPEPPAQPQPPTAPAATGPDVLAQTGSTIASGAGIVALAGLLAGAVLLIVRRRRAEQA
ncbi:hypothetical protein LLS1_35260 [Leifsonia sp. LS1]|uniref:Ig-like domain-containing protein n=1 Tax=Leifsonia sp. LS1 TaxID=2828483 RepID=UPI001CFD0BD4|nr:Ig-like domain-containing protein [Leifsonia sp. LS1]GIT81857.1 hypothetical protein LLS1_35260 [Leifsonia sp. LS1]